MKPYIVLKRVLIALGARVVIKYIRISLSFYKWKVLSRKSNIKLELGSGEKKGASGWTTIDIGGADIYWDLRLGIPLPDNSVNAIYSSHLLEHIPFQSLIIFLQECRRVLKDDGYFSVCVPDSALFIKAYIEKRNFLEDHEYYVPAKVDTDSYLDQVNYIAYMSGQHQYMFDDQNLIGTLRKAGFSNVSLRDFDPTLDLEDRHKSSIYAVGFK